jgi:hypothetical protein
VTTSTAWAPAACACCGNHDRTVADRLERGGDQPGALLLRERRRLTGRAVDDDPVGAVVDEELAELAVAVVIDRPVRVEGRHGRGQDLT